MTKKYPFYFRATVILFGLILFAYGLAVLREVFVPLAFALLIAMLLNPLVAFLERHGFSKVPAIATVLLVSIIASIAITWLLYLQVNSFSDRLPAFSKKFGEFGSMLQSKAKNDLGISIQKQANTLRRQKQV